MKIKDEEEIVRPQEKTATPEPSKKATTTQLEFDQGNGRNNRAQPLLLKMSVP